MINQESARHYGIHTKIIESKTKFNEFALETIKNNKNVTPTMQLFLPAFVDYVSLLENRNILNDYFKAELYNLAQNNNFECYREMFPEYFI